MELILFLLLLVAGSTVTVLLKKLTVAGAVTGGILAMLIFLGAGWSGIVMLAAFFIMASLATSFHRHSKEKYLQQNNEKPMRTAGQVLANGGAAALIVFFSWIIPGEAYLLLILLAATLASATADTLSSELGIIYGSRFYNIITFERDQKGLDGVVSMEGTLIGMAGSAVIATIYALFWKWDINFLVIILAGTAGNVADSVLGAVWERKHLISNNVVNFLNTIIAAVVAWLLYLFFHSSLFE